MPDWEQPVTDPQLPPQRKINMSTSPIPKLHNIRPELGSLLSQYQDACILKDNAEKEERRLAQAIQEFVEEIQRKPYVE